MKIRLMSDIHMEFYYMMRENSYTFIPEMEDDKETVLILAGDIGTVRSYDMTIIQELSERFREVIIILGNHEHYKSDINQTMDIIKGKWDETTCDIEINNVHFIEKESVIIDNVRFIGTTFWTNFCDDINAEMYANMYMNDFRIIKSGDYRFDAHMSKMVHYHSLEFIREELKEAKRKKQKTVVITHHAPSTKSTHARFKASLLNPAFVSNHDDFIMQHQPNLWCHGHIHDRMNYYIGKTRVEANPSGYPNEDRDVPHDPKLIIEI